MLTGRQHGKEITEEQCALACRNELLVAYACSDSGLTLRGMVSDGYTVGKNHSVFLAYEEGRLRFIATRSIGMSTPFLEIWMRQESRPKASFADSPLKVSSNVAFSPFDIFKGDSLFCRGIVVAKEDIVRELFPPPASLGHDTPIFVVDGALHCPHCKGYLLHQQKVEVFHQRPHDHFGLHATIQSGSCGTDNFLGQVPRPDILNSSFSPPDVAADQYQLRLWLLCGTCGTTKTLSIFQHGGSIRMEWGL